MIMITTKIKFYDLTQYFISLFAEDAEIYRVVENVKDEGMKLEKDVNRVILVIRWFYETPDGG